MAGSATWIDQYLKMIADCEARESRLTEWEVGFLDSISAQLAAERPLSVKQTDTLDRIWEHATGRG